MRCTKTSCVQPRPLVQVLPGSPLSLRRTHTPSVPCRRHLTTVCAWEGAPPLFADSITSTANAYVKHCVRLRTSRGYREEAGRLLISGVAPLTELAAACGDMKIHALFVTCGEAPADLPPANRYVSVSAPVMRKLAGFDSPPTGLQVTAEVEAPTAAEFVALPSLQRLLVLDGIQDPGNLGTLMRTALALGWQGAFLLPGCCDAYNDKALRAARGAAFKLPHARGTWADLQRVVDAHRLVCLAAQLPDEGSAAELSDTKRRLPCDGGLCLVLGSEGQGLSAQAVEACRPVSVPMDGDMESLNVGIAGGILMFALSKARDSLIL